MMSRGVEISIAGGGGEMVRAYLLVGFFLFLLFSSFFFSLLIFVLRYNGHISTSYVDKKPPTTVHPASPG